MKYTFEFLEDEVWWGGASVKGTEYPLTKNSVLYENFHVKVLNQAMPFYLSNKGRYIWSENPFEVKVENGIFYFEGEDIAIYDGGNSLKDAYLTAMKKHFPFNKKKLPREFFKTAQYCTWMEFTYEPTQEGVLNYAKSIIDNGLEPGILIIDEGWHKPYGIWDFDFYKFPNPKEMVDKLHKMGFIVMLWVVPCVSPDGFNFITNVDEQLNFTGRFLKPFIKTKEGKPALFWWWNGFSALLDLRKEDDKTYLSEKLDYLMETYGIDGFKFDGGSVDMYTPSNIVNGEPSDDHDAIAMNIAWNEFGTSYTYHEFKDTFKGGGKNAIQRICDRGHKWDEDGINTLIPCMIAQGLIGTPFICPDMIGGGQWNYAQDPDFKVDEELFVRMAQASALAPMMQFSWAPWRVVSKENYQHIVEAAQLHKKMADKIIDVISESEISGEPVIRNLEYNYPNQGYAFIKDEFMVGKDILVAPVITKETYERKVVFPEGKWKDEDGNIFKGNSEYILKSPINKLLYFIKIK